MDDEPDALDFLRAYLSTEGFDVVQAASGEQALTLIDEQRPHLVIIDYMMPGMTGLELCQELRGRTDTHDIPIIIYSAYEMRHSDTGLFERSFMKPADLDEMLSAIRSLLPAASQ